MKLVILDGHAVNPGDLSWDGLRAFGEVQVYAHTAPSDTVAHIGDAQLVLTNKTVISAEILGACPQIRYIGVLATGYNVVDLSAAAARGIAVTNIPAYSTQRVAHTAVMLLLNLASSMRRQLDMLSRGDRSNFTGHLQCPHAEVNGKTLGVIGAGHIGKEVIRVARALDMEVLAYSRTPKDDGVCYVGLDELLSRSDFVSLHCPLSDQTRHLINADTLAKMKPTACLINTSRGALVDEPALIAALQNGVIAGAGLDVQETEPPAADNPLYDMDNVILTPHMGWKGLETRQRLVALLTGNIRSYLEGRPIHVVS